MQIVGGPLSLGNARVLDHGHFLRSAAQISAGITEVLSTCAKFGHSRLCTGNKFSVHSSLTILFCPLCACIHSFLYSQLRHDCHEGAIQQILSNSSVCEMPGSPATQDLFFLLCPLLVQRVDAGMRGHKRIICC